METAVAEAPDSLTELISSEAQKRGVSARKAMKKLRQGGMAQIAPQLHSQFMEMNPTISPRDKLKMKLNKMREGRSCSHAKAVAYEKTKQEVHERQEREAEEKEQKKKADARRKKNHQRALKELEKQLGTISLEMYNQCMANLQTDQYKDVGQRNRDRNIVELYGMQQQFTDVIDMDELNEI